jgi:hypothetical protein
VGTTGLESVVEATNPHLRQEATLLVALKPHLGIGVPSSKRTAQEQTDLIATVLFDGDDVLFQR